jgi:group I intron endonuclease
VRGIYKIINRNNGKYYVGSSTDLADRWREHKRHLRSGKHINPKLLASWNKHGENVFYFVVMEEHPDATRTQLLEAEQKYLDIAKTEIPMTYNVRFVAGGGWDWDRETFRKSIVRGKAHLHYCHDVHTFMHKETGETFIGTRCDFYTEKGLDKKDVRRLVQGKALSVNGWKLESVAT